MAVIDLVNAGSSAYVAALFNSGTDPVEIARRVQERFPTASSRDVATAVEYGRRAWSAGTTLDVGAGDQSVSAGQVPRAQGQGTGWSYTVILHLHQPGAETQSESIGYRQFEVRSPRSLTRDEVAEAAERASRLAYSSLSQGSEDAPTHAQWFVDETEILAVERF